MKHIFSYMLIIIYIALLPAYVIPRILYNVKHPRGCLERGSPCFVFKLRDIYAGYDTISASTSARLVPEKA